MVNEVQQTEVPHFLEQLFERDSRRILATLVRTLGDIELAEDAMQEAFAAAASAWEAEGVPEQPVSWLISAGRFRAVDLIRRDIRFRELQPELVARIEQVAANNSSIADQEIEDDRLRLIFTCCHPSIDPSIQVPLTLREVCGLSTEEIANAFLVSTKAMAQRIVRGKAKIRRAGVPFVIPDRDHLPERLDAVLSVIYLVFNEGYSASAGARLTRVELSSEAIRLCRLVLDLMPDPEVVGLLALMLLHESRRDARLDERGDLVLLEDQDRSLWNREYIEEGMQLVERALASGRFGSYTLQAAISAVHAEAATASQTDWTQIVSLYDVLCRLTISPVARLNRAVAIAMRDGPLAGVEIIDAILDRGELGDYHLAHSARGELLRRAGRTADAIGAFERAVALVKEDSQRRFLTARLKALQSDA